MLCAWALPLAKVSNGAVFTVCAMDFFSFSFI